MLAAPLTNKLREITDRAISVNITLLAEEIKLAEALSHNPRPAEIQQQLDCIKNLMRKESLYQQLASALVEGAV